MELNGHQSTLANPLVRTFMRQASVKGEGERNRSVGLPFHPSVSLREQDTSSYTLWSHKHPFERIISDMKSRTDCDKDTELEALVSSTLDEAESQESYYSVGNPSTCNPLWSPQTLKKKFLQYFQSEAETQYNSTFIPNHISGESYSRAQGGSVGADKFPEHPNGLATNQPWLINLRNGDRDSFHIHPQKLPPGLPIPIRGNTSLSQIQLSKRDNMSADKDRAYSQSTNNLPEISDVLRPQSHLNSTFTASEHGGVCRGGFPNMHRKMMNGEEGMGEQWNISSPAEVQKKERRRIWEQMSGFVGERFSTRPLITTHMKERDIPAPPRSKNVDFTGSMQRFVGENSMVSSGNIQQLMPCMMSAAPVRNQGGTLTQLSFYLDECNAQLRCLKKERKKTEALLTIAFAEKLTEAVIRTNLPKTSPHPVDVDHLIVNHRNEVVRVECLLEKIKCLFDIPFRAYISTVLNQHILAISFVQERCRVLANIANQQQQRARFTEDRDTQLLVIVLKDVAATTRNLRAVLWNVLHKLMPRLTGRSHS